MNLHINLENCYGIKKLNHTFDFSRGSVQLVYAPNGSMKTSFAKTMKFLSGQSKDEPKDLLNPDVLSTKDITFNDNHPVTRENIFVVNGDEEIDSSKSFTSFLASLELKQRYDSIYQLLKRFKITLRGDF